MKPQCFFARSANCVFYSLDTELIGIIKAYYWLLIFSFIRWHSDWLISWPIGNLSLITIPHLDWFMCYYCLDAGVFLLTWNFQDLISIHSINLIDPIRTLCWINFNSITVLKTNLLFSLRCYSISTCGYWNSEIKILATLSYVKFLMLSLQLIGKQATNGFFPLTIKSLVLVINWLLLRIFMYVIWLPFQLAVFILTGGILTYFYHRVVLCRVYVDFVWFCPFH